MDGDRLRILLVEDDEEDYNLTRDMLEKSVSPAIELDRVATYDAALKAFARSEHDLYLVDYRLPGRNGLELLRQAIAGGCQAPIIVVTGLGGREIDVEAMKAGAADFLVKGQFTAPTLERSIRHALQRAKSQAVLRKQAMIDELTGLYNRQAFLGLAEQHMKLAARRKNALILIVAGLDRLKQINDLFGHQEGDRALTIAASLVKKAFRSTDIVARIGGDEFAALAIDTAEHGVEAVTARFRGKLKDHSEQSAHSYELSLTIGAVRFDPSSAVSLDALVSGADQAMYEGKRGGITADDALAPESIEPPPSNHSSAPQWISGAEGGGTMMPNDRRLRVLLVEGNENDFVVTRDLLSSIDGGGFDLEWARSYEAGLKAMTGPHHDICLVGFRLGNRDGVELLREARRAGCQAPIILLTEDGVADGAVGIESIRGGAADYLIKSHLSAELLERSIRYAIERKRSEEALRESEERYRTFIKQSAEGVYCFEIERPIPTASPEEERIETFWRYGYLAECNEAMARMYGFSRPEDIIGVRPGELSDPADPKNSELARAFARSGYRLENAESHETDKDGAQKYFLNNLVGIVEDGRLVRVWGTQRDITEHKRIEEDLRLMLQWREAIFEGSRDAIFISDAESHLILVNTAACEMTGFSKDELHDARIEDLLLGADIPAFRARHGRALAGEDTVWEAKLVKKSGRYVDAEFSMRRIVISDAVYVHSVARDITERKHAEAALRESEGQFRLLFERNPQPMWVFDQETLFFLAVNDAAVDHYGYSREEFLEMTIADIRPSEDIPALIEAVLGGRQALSAGRSWRHQKKDGTLIDVEIAAHGLTFAGRPARLVLATDVSARRRLEEQFRQAQKMEAVGRLAGGVAHDFNNLLTAINGYADLLMMSLGEGDSQRSTLEEIRKAGDRAAALTNQLLLFSRRHVLQPKVIDLNTVITNSSKMLGRLIGEDVELLTRPHAEPRFVKADPMQLEQVLLNLVVNARDAMPDGGTLLLEIADAYLDEDYAQRHVAVGPGPYVMLAVSDTGCGIPEEARPHIFEPFYTTKGEGKGTGLGLSTVYGIVEHSGGHIGVYSEVGRGTTFKVYLPEAKSDDDGGATPSVLAEAPRGSETILLVEDEEMVRQLAREILELNGYNVLEAAGAEQALQHCSQHRDPIHLMVTDVVMPVMCGRELAARISGSHPETKVLYMSGYTDDAIVHHGILDGTTAFMQKPFTPFGFASRVREVLDDSRKVASVDTRRIVDTCQNESPQRRAEDALK
ncbi:MAG TPA: PAS domain S-box protein [Blastocatellia bacterium]|nr:PAS domain S-box protein [Blastocatellia bacterium]